jgi:hypothetical protein
MERRAFIGGLLALGFALSGFKAPEHESVSSLTWGTMRASVTDEFGNGIEGTLVTCVTSEGRAYYARADKNGIATFNINLGREGEGYASFSV